MTPGPLTTSSERIDKDRVKLRVEVPEETLAPSIDAAYKRWASEIKVPGFRKGKVPRQLIDARVGADAVREEAFRDALPGLYREALEVERLEAIAPPEIDVVAFENGSPIVFEATVDLRPEVDVPDLSQIRVDAPSSEVTDADVDEQLERLRDRFAELDTVSREARRGDFVLIDLKGYVHDEPVEGASAPDFLYEVGSQSGPGRLDEELEGSRPGAILKFNDVAPSTAGDLAGQEISYTVLVKEVKAKRLPALDDEFAKTVGDFETLDDLKGDLRSRLADVKLALAEEELRGLVLEALVDASSFDPPERLVESEFEHRLAHVNEDLGRAGLTLEEYARRSNSTELEIRRDIRAQGARAIKAELLLEEIARKENVQVGEEDISKEIAVAAVQAEKDPKELAEQVVSSGRLPSIAADIMRRKALEHVVHNVNVVGRAADEE
jgi:trigger factor